MRSPRVEIPRHVVNHNRKVPELMSAVKKLYSLSSLELIKLMRDSDNNTLQFINENGSFMQIDVEDLAKIPIHLLALLVQSAPNKALFTYLLSGLSLLHTLYDIAPRHLKLEQILHDDISLLNQLFDLIFYTLIVLDNYTQEHQPSTPIALLHSTLVASSLFLLTGFVSSQWSEVSNILVHHPKVDRFMDAAFAAVRVDIELLQITLSAQSIDSCVNSSPTAAEQIKHLSQQCEVSLQFLQTLCQQKTFQEHLVKHKELCGKGGILLLARLVFDLHISTSLHELNYVAAAVSRMKSKILSILLHLCEAETISFLDEVASTPESLDLAKSVVLEVLESMKTLCSGNAKDPSSCSDLNIPKGLLQLNAMRLTDIFSDDTNFRVYVTQHITEVFTTLFSLPHGEFLSCWCSSDPLFWEEDATLEYDPFVAAGWILSLLSSSDMSHTMTPESTFIPCNMSRASYAHQRTSLLVKVIANLHCFVPDICKEEKDLFLNSFSKCLQKELPKLSDGSSSNSAVDKADAISRNLCSLLIHAESLIPRFLNQEDVQLLRVFINQLESVISTAEFKKNLVQEAQNVESSGSDSSSSKHKISTDQIIDVEHIEEAGFGGVQDDEKAGTIQCAEMHQRKRKRTIMNDTQINLIEKALLDKPDMHRHAASLKLWADHLSEHGSEVTASQLKNWLNNRKARLARTAKDVRGPSEGVNDKPGGSGIRPLNDKPGGSGIRPLNDLPNSSVEDLYVPLAPQVGSQDETGGSILKTGHNNNSESVVAESVVIVPAEGQYVMLVDEQGEEIGKGYVYQVHGKWYGRNLEELRTCVVDIIELKSERWARLPHPFEATGTSFDQAEKKLGVLRVLWDSNKLFIL